MWEHRTEQQIEVAKVLTGEVRIVPKNTLLVKECTLWQLLKAILFHKVF